jgi:choline-sulfatase
MSTRFRSPPWPTLLALAVGACSGGEAPPSLLLVTLDTTRADALSAYGGPDTPALARLASEGVVFEHAQSAIPITLPSHATLLTGLTPLRHGVRDNGRNPLAPGARTLAEIAHEAGFQTAAFVAAVVLDPTFGLDQGFDHYDAPESPGRAVDEHEAQRPASEIVDAALGWLAERDRSRPFLLWTHFYDPHTPYEPPPEFGGRTLREKYDGEVRAMDREIGRLFDALRGDGTLDRTLVIVVGDHGEAFGEHGENGHSPHAWQTTLHVPMIVRAPFLKRLTPGTRSDELVGTVDVLPTVAEALDLEIPGDLDGFSLWNQPAPPDRGLYFETYYGWFHYGWSPVAGWMDARGKYLHTSDPHYHDWRADPGEEHDLLTERPAEVKAAQRAIAVLAEKPRLDTAEANASEEMLASLRGLGYASSGSTVSAIPHPLASSDLPSPERMIPVMDRMIDGLAAGKAGRLEEAEQALREVLTTNPQNPEALEALASTLVPRRRYAEAVEVLERMVGMERGRTSSAFFKLGLCLEATGEPERAIETLRIAVEMDPQRTTVRTELARMLRAAGRRAEAAELLAEGR